MVWSFDCIYLIPGCWKTDCKNNCFHLFPLLCPLRQAAWPDAAAEWMWKEGFSSCLLAALILAVNELLLQETFCAGDPPVQERKHTRSLLASLALLGSDRYYSSNTQLLSVWEHCFFSRGAFLISWSLFFSVSSLTDLSKGVLILHCRLPRSNAIWKYDHEGWWVAVLQQSSPAIGHILPPNQWRENIGSLMVSPCYLWYLTPDSWILEVT